LGLDLTVQKAPVSDHAARAGAEGVFRYVWVNGAQVTKTTMMHAFAGGNIEILHLVKTRVPIDDASTAEVAAWAEASILNWNFIQTNWLLMTMRPDVLRDAKCSKKVWLAAAQARDFALLRTLPKPEFHFAPEVHSFLALLCSAKGSDLSNTTEVVEKLLDSDDIEGFALFALAVSVGELETRRVEGDALTIAVGFVRNIEVIDAVTERVELGPDDPSPLMVACASNDRGVAIALLNGGCDVDRATHGTSRWRSALALACYQGPEWRDVVEFLCRKITLGKADLPPGECAKGAVHWACESKSAAIVKLVCGRADVVVNRVDERATVVSTTRWTALLRARLSRWRRLCSIAGFHSTGRGFASSRMCPVRFTQCRVWSN
jgi:hypothetical protein